MCWRRLVTSCTWPPTNGHSSELPRCLAYIYVSPVGQEADVDPRRHRKRQINLNDPFRVTGLTAGAKLELVSKSKTTSVVNIALRLPDAEAKDIPNGRLMDKFRSDTTLWKMLRHFEAKGAPSGRTLNFTDRGVPQTSNGLQAGSGQLYYEMPVLRIMNREISTLVEFQKTLSQLGLDSGSQMIQLSFKSTDRSLNDAMQEISQFFKEEEVAVDQDKDAAPKPEPAPAAESSSAAAPAPAPAETVPEPSGPSDEVAPKTADSVPNNEGATEKDEPSADPAAGAADDMDVDKPAAAPHDVLKPVNIFSAPTNATIAAASIDLPDFYYTPTIAHAQAHQQSLQQNAVNRRLKSDAELAAEARAEEAKIASVKTIEVKVRFPDQTSAQWVFTPDDTGATLYKAVRSVMADDAAPFKLVLPGPSSTASPSHIRDDAADKHRLVKGYRLAGRVLVNLLWDDGVSPDVRSRPFLKGEFAGQARAVEVPDIPEVEDEPVPSTFVPSAPPKPQSAGEGSGSAKKMPKWLKGLGGKK